jgi:hypothetical protein
MLNKLPTHEDVQGTGSIALCIFNIGAKRRGVVSFTPLPLYPRRKGLCYSLGGWIAQSQSGVFFKAAGKK